MIKARVIFFFGKIRDKYPSHDVVHIDRIIDLVITRLENDLYYFCHELSK
jgi:hypothetical protein